MFVVAMAFLVASTLTVFAFMLKPLKQEVVIAPQGERVLLEPVVAGGFTYGWREPNDPAACKMNFSFAKPNTMVDGPVLKGVSFKIPYNADWAGPNYRLTPYSEDYKTDSVQEFEFGPLRLEDRVAPCEWSRNYHFSIEYTPSSGSYEDDFTKLYLASIKRLLIATDAGGGSIKSPLVIEKMAVSPPNYYEFMMLKYIYGANDGSSGQYRTCHLEVVGRSITLDFSGRCQEEGSEEDVFDQLKTIVDSIQFDRNF